MYKGQNTATLKSFRRDIARLKRAGLISGVDARAAKPGDKFHGRKLSTLVARYDDVLSNKVAPVKVSPSKLRAYRKAGYETSQGRLLVPHSALERVSVNRQGHVVKKHPAGLTRVQIPVEFHNLEQYLKDVDKRGKYLETKYTIGSPRNGKKLLGFRVFGNNSTQTFDKVHKAVAFLQKYRAKIPRAGTQTEVEFYQNLEFVTLENVSQWNRERKVSRAERKINKREREARKKMSYRNNLKKNKPEQYRAMQKKNAANMRAKRKKK